MAEIVAANPRRPEPKLAYGVPAMVEAVEIADEGVEQKREERRRRDGVACGHVAGRIGSASTCRPQPEARRPIGAWTSRLQLLGEGLEARGAVNENQEAAALGDKALEVATPLIARRGLRRHGAHTAVDAAPYAMIGASSPMLVSAPHPCRQRNALTRSR
jgi:hypothetical protein